MVAILVLVELGQDSSRISAKGCLDSVSTGRCHESRWDGRNCSHLGWSLDLRVQCAVTSPGIRAAVGLYFVSQGNGRRCGAYGIVSALTALSKKVVYYWGRLPESFTRYINFGGWL